MYGDPLTALERDVIAMLVRQAHPHVDAFGAQLAACRTRAASSPALASTRDSSSPQTLAVAGMDRLTLSHVAAEIDGLPQGARFVLFIEGGMLELLEGFMYDGLWPDRIEAFTLRSLTSPDPETADAALRATTAAPGDGQS